MVARKCARTSRNRENRRENREKMGKNRGFVTTGEVGKASGNTRADSDDDRKVLGWSDPRARLTL